MLIAEAVQKSLPMLAALAHAVLWVGIVCPLLGQTLSALAQVTCIYNFFDMFSYFF